MRKILKPKENLYIKSCKDCGRVYRTDKTKTKFARLAVKRGRTLRAGRWNRRNATPKPLRYPFPKWCILSSGTTRNTALATPTGSIWRWYIAGLLNPTKGGKSRASGRKIGVNGMICIKCFWRNAIDGRGIYPMKRYVSKKIICPYYKHERRQVIDCFGVNDKTVLHLAFANPKEWYDYKQNICSADYKKCPLYQMLETLHQDNILSQ